MKKRLFSILLLLAILISSMAVIASCENPENETDAGTEEQSVEETDTSGEESEKESDEIETDDDPGITDETVYENGDSVTGAGITWYEGAFQTLEHPIDESKAEDISAAELIELLKDRNALTGEKVYRLSEPLKLASDTKYYGNGTAIIAPHGIIIENASNIVVKEIVVKGKITVTESEKITLFKIDSKGENIGIEVDGKSSNISIKSCRIVSEETAVKIAANVSAFSQNYLSAKVAVVSTGSDMAMYNNTIKASEIGILSSGAYASIKNSEFTVSAEGTGIKLIEGSVNALVALNVIKDAQTSVLVEKGFNCVVLLNSLISVKGYDNTNLYVNENKLGGYIELKDNNYLLCNQNTFKKDDLNHPVINSGNLNFNGNNLHNIAERVEYGANEELLPQTNKDLFLEMEKRNAVRDISQAKSYDFKSYLKAYSMGGDTTIIIAPGVYNLSSTIVLGKAHSNTKLYAYGVYLEKESLGGILQFNQSQNYTVKGLTIGYEHQSSGQVYVLEKMENNKIRVVSNAGYLNDFGRSNTAVFSGSWNNMFKADSLVPWIDISSNYEFVSKEEDGTMIFQLTGKDAPRIYSSTDPGDVWCCRLAGDNLSTLALYTATNTSFEDVVVYGYAAALSMSTAWLTDGISLHRYHNTTHSGRIIDEATYNKYLALEEQYGVDLEVYKDEYGRYRGGASREGSVDATHISQSVRGADATSCIFEGMSDDGSNQRASSSRLAGIVNNNDGTATVYIKGSIAEVYFSYYLSRGSASASTTLTPRQGDRIYAYGSGGDIIFDEVTLTAAKPAESLDAIHAIHTDCSTNNGICSVCGIVSHSDTKPRDGKCDTCGAAVHVDTNKNALCDVSGCGISIPDANKDNICDDDNVTIIHNRLDSPTFNPSNGQLSFDVNYNGTPYTYNTVVYEFTIPSENVNWDAVDKYNLSSNEYAMKDKILVDNLSANSGYFTFDNVLIQNARARGVVCKTVNATVKNCTFRNLAAAGVLMSIETTWGESTVAQDVTVEGCLFENTGYYFNTQSDMKRASLSIQGLGELSSNVTVSEDTLPCRNITIKNNKFNGTRNNYYIAVSAAQNVVIEGNVFCDKDGETTQKPAKAINISGCYNVNISGNTYSSFSGGDVTKAIVANNYKELHGSDVEGVFPTQKDPVN